MPCHAAGAPRLLLIHWLRCALPCRAVLCCAGRGGARPGKGGGGWGGCGGWTLVLPRPKGLRGSCGLFINGAEGLGEVVPAKGACVLSRCVAEGFPLLLRSTRLPKQRSQPLTTPLWHIEKALKVFILSPGLCVWLCPGCCAFERTLKSNLKTLAKKKKKKKKIFLVLFFVQVMCGSLQWMALHILSLALLLPQRSLALSSTIPQHPSVAPPASGSCWRWQGQVPVLSCLPFPWLELIPSETSWQSFPPIPYGCLAHPDVSASVGARSAGW